MTIAMFSMIISVLPMFMMVLASDEGQPTVIGCYADKEEIRDLPHAFIITTANTLTSCQQHCHHKGYMFAGAQNGAFCSCGNSYGRYNTSDRCFVHCMGDKNTICGGHWANSVMKTGLLTPEVTKTMPPATRTVSTEPTKKTKSPTFTTGVTACDNNPCDGQKGAVCYSSGNSHLCVHVCASGVTTDQCFSELDNTLIAKDSAICRKLSDS